MNTSRRGRVVVATSGSAASTSAVTYAAHEAVARSVPLEVVHVVPPVLASGPYAATPVVELRRAGQQVLTRGEQLVRQLEPDPEITTTMLIGSRVGAIVHHAADADLLVVGAPPHDLVGRIWTGSTVTGTVARSTCPTAVVPVGTTRPATHRVLVGLKSTSHVTGLLTTAFAVASQTQSDLRIVHAWRMVSPYDEAIAQRLPTPSWEVSEKRAIEAQLTDLRMIYPGVQVEVELIHGQPAYALVEGSRDTDVLVISRPVHGGLVHHLGSTARAVIREAHCPLLVVPPLDEVTEPEHLLTEPALVP
jgi:nucleotide-binding universal stress UspA family protein